MNSIRPPQHPRQEEAGEVQGEVGPQLRKFLKNLGCQKCILALQEPAHPLASSGPESLSPGHSAPIPRLTQATPASVARLLRSVLEKPHPLVESSSCFLLCSPNDIDRVRMLIRDLTIKALIPWVEKQLKHLHEVVTNRKSRCDLESDSWSYKPLTAQGGHCPMVVVIHCRQWKLLVNHLSLHPCH